MSDRPSAPNFTNAFICMAGIILFCMLVAVYAFYGLIGATLFAIVMDKAVIQRVPAKIRDRA